MKFCSECGSIMKPKEQNDEKIFICSQCNNKEKPGSDDEMSIKEEKEDEDEFEVIEKETDHLPTTQEECPECGHEEAYYWTVQTRAGDEPETKFLKCTECDHTWREYA